MTSFLSTALLTVALLAVGAQAWWCTGHMVIATIAKTVMDQSVIDHVESAAQWINSNGFPLSDDMVTLACWADDLKSNDDAMASWHFINQAYDTDGTPVPPTLIQKENVATVTEQMYSSIKRNPNTWELGMAVAYVIHLIGDIHQPLHATTLVDAQFPNSDRGGNLFDVSTATTGPIHLHQVWDSICTQYMQEPARPLNSSARSLINSIANQFMSEFNFTNAEMSVYNTSVMAEESFEAAENYAYAGIQPGDTLSSSYLSTCLSVAAERIALAGYRLGNQLQYLFSSGMSKNLQGSDLARHIVKNAGRAPPKKHLKQ